MSRMEKNSVSGESCMSYLKPKHFITPDACLKVGVLKENSEMAAEITSHFTEI